MLGGPITEFRKAKPNAAPGQANHRHPLLADPVVKRSDRDAQEFCCLLDPQQPIMCHAWRVHWLSRVFPTSYSHDTGLGPVKISSVRRFSIEEKSPQQALLHRTHLAADC